MDVQREPIVREPAAPANIFDAFTCRALLASQVAATIVKRRGPCMAAAVGTACISLVVSGCGSSGSSGSSVPTAPTTGDAHPAVRVAGTTITDLEINALVNQSEREAEQSGWPIPQPGTPSYAELRRQAAQTLVANQVLLSAARRCGRPCVVTQAQATASITRMEKIAGSNAAKIVSQSGRTRAEAVRQAQLDVTARRLAGHIAGSVHVTRTQALAAYTEHLSSYMVPGRPGLRMILVKTHAQATALRARLTDADFAVLARAKSIDRASRTRGGELTHQQQTRLPATVSAAAASLPASTISPPVKGPAGWYLIEAYPTSAHLVPFSRVEQVIVSNQTAAIQQARFAVWWRRTLAANLRRVRYLDPSLAPPAPHRTASSHPTTRSRTSTGRS